MAYIGRFKAFWPDMSDYLTSLRRAENERNLKRLQSVMNRFNLKRSEVGYLLGRDSRLISKWFKHKAKCPDNAPEMLRAIVSIRSESEWREEIIMKRRK